MFLIKYEGLQISERERLLMKKVNKFIFGMMIAFILFWGAVEEIPNFKCVTTVEAANKKIKLNKSKATIYVGNIINLELKSVAAKKVKWSSSRNSVATVSKYGKVTARKKGTANISAKYKGKTYKCRVTVKSARISNKKLTLRVGFDAYKGMLKISSIKYF